MQSGILYISYDGMLEPLGQSQVLAYLRQLSVDRRIHLISFEKAEDWANLENRTCIESEINTAGIKWYPLRYHKRPSALATAWDIACGTLVGLWLVLRFNLRIVHARSYVASVMALALKRVTRINYLFDMRGFWADEKIDGGTWTRGGFMYRFAKAFERRFLLSADHVVTLTKAGLQVISRFDYLQGRMPQITVIPTCADLSRFSPQMESKTCYTSAGFVLGYVGSVGTYYLFDEVLACFLHLKRVRPKARFLIVNFGQHEYIRERLAFAGISNKEVELTSIPHSQIPNQIARMDAGIFFIKPLFSKQASAPTKLAEFLGCGVPCLVNAGVGDMTEIIEGEKVGVAVKSFSALSMELAVEQLLGIVANPRIKVRCVGAAKKHFSLDEGVRRYQKIYDLLEK